MLPVPPSKVEAMFYYAGLPSGPPLVARSSTTAWKKPTGPEAYRKIKELRPVGDHPLKEIWEDKLVLELHALLDSMEVKWSSTDVVRTRIVGESSDPIILWIGCRELLEENDIIDVDVEIRESVVTRLIGPKLLTSDRDSNPTVDVRDPLTTTLGLPICSQSTPQVEGTGGFFIAEGGNTERLLLVTARHVVFPPDRHENKPFQHENSQPRHDVLLFSDAAFNKYLESIQVEIERQAIMADYQERRIKAVEGDDDQAANEERKHAGTGLRKAKRAIEKLNAFYQDVSTQWATQESRLLGHVILSPPIDVGIDSECYTEDWAIIEIDSSKIDASNFKGNTIDLGTRIPFPDFIRMLCPDLESARSFKYPIDRLLRLQGTIPDEEMRRPTAFNQNGEPYLMVIKHGITTGLTVGRANDIFSYVRNYCGNGDVKTSKEWAVLPFDSKSGAFSEKGDSGSVIVDGRGRIGGLLTSGAGNTSYPDITYATPISFLLERMQIHGLREPNISPVLTA